MPAELIAWRRWDYKGRTMATIILHNFDQERGTRLAAVLHSCGHRILTEDKQNLTDSCIERHSVDLIILDLTRTVADVRSELHELAHLRKANGLPVPILCYSRVYRGPSFELKVERSGARLVYEG